MTWETLVQFKVVTVADLTDESCRLPGLFHGGQHGGHKLQVGQEQCWAGQGGESNPTEQPRPRPQLRPRHHPRQREKELPRPLLTLRPRPESGQPLLQQREEAKIPPALQHPARGVQQLGQAVTPQLLRPQ